ncbi:hypothetical protein PIIN_03296 [Serendipita indica DSM 11827]|uniref:Uncharacterized protein n=1 Tax=Serendipita indica (strain DSM 11827) TaxID=1109443 RepID=G4TDM4_SERID|nr:hypothetical protein PIIN_03296 [Serendipita indica DSM 11827]
MGTSSVPPRFPHASLPSEMSDYSRSTLEPRPCQLRDGSIYIRENEAWGHHPNGERDFDIGPLRHPDLTNVGEERAELYKKLYRLRHDQRSIGRFDSVGVTRPIYNPIKPLKPSDLDLPNRSPSSTYSKLLRRVSPLANEVATLKECFTTSRTNWWITSSESTSPEYSVIEATPRISRNVAETEAKRPGEPNFQAGHRFIAEESPKTEASTGISDLLAIAKEHSRGVERHGQAWIYVAVGLALSLGAIEHEPSLDLVDRALAEILSYEKGKSRAKKAPIKQEPGLLDPFLSTSNPGSLSRAEIAETIEQDDATVLMQNPGSKEFKPFSWAAGISTHGATEAPKKDNVMVLFARALDLHLEPGNLAIKETDRPGEPVIVRLSVLSASIRPPSDMSGYIRVGPEPRPCDTFKTSRSNFWIRDGSIYIRENGIAKNYNNGEDEFDIGPRRPVDLTKLDRDRVEKYFDLYESCPELDQASTPVASRYSNSVEMMTPISTPTASPMTPLSQLDSGSHPSLPSTSISDMIANLSIETIQNNRFGSYLQALFYPSTDPTSILSGSTASSYQILASQQARNTSTPFDPTYMEASTGTQVHMHSPQTMPSLASITESASTNRINPNITVENEALSRSVEEAV